MSNKIHVDPFGVWVTVITFVVLAGGIFAIDYAIHNWSPEEIRMMDQIMIRIAYIVSLVAIILVFMFLVRHALQQKGEDL